MNLLGHQKFDIYLKLYQKMINREVIHKKIYKSCMKTQSQLWQTLHVPFPVLAFSRQYKINITLKIVHNSESCPKQSQICIPGTSYTFYTLFSMQAAYLFVKKLYSMFLISSCSVMTTAQYQLTIFVIFITILDPTLDFSHTGSYKISLVGCLVY